MKRICCFILNKFHLYIFKLKWRKRNKHNFTTAGIVFPLEKISVGNYSYGSLNVYDFGEVNSGLEIGNLCSIALNVNFILGGNHHTSDYLTYPVIDMLAHQGIGCFSKGKIMIGHDCWIGFGATILSGVTLGNGCVVAAGSVVVNSFPAYSIIGGNPAKLIRYRFESEIISVLDANKWIYRMPPEWYKHNVGNLTKKPTLENISMLKGNRDSKTI